MTGSLESWTCVVVWVVAALVLATTGITGVLLATVAAGCGGYRAYADGLGLHRARR
jgi:hypothetical protein